jgi:hypothetical protein
MTTWFTQISISSGALLYINGSVGTTGIINNEYSIKIEMFASDEYDTTVSL